MKELNDIINTLSTDHGGQETKEWRNRQLTCRHTDSEVRTYEQDKGTEVKITQRQAGKVDRQVK